MPVQDDQFRASYSSLAPKHYPESLIVPVQEGLDILKMYTSGLRVLVACPDICLQKALDLIDEGPMYSLALSVFRHELTQRMAKDCEFGEVDALICGIDALVNHLRQYFNHNSLFIGSKLAYVYDRYIEPGMLVMTKLTYFNGNLSKQSHPSFYLSSERITAALPTGA